MVQAAHGAVRFVVAHHIIEPDDFLQRLINRIGRLRHRLAIGDNLEDRAHNVLFLVNEGSLGLRRLG